MHPFGGENAHSHSHLPRSTTVILGSGDYDQQQLNQYWNFRIPKPKPGVIPKPVGRLTNAPLIWAQKTDNEVLRSIELFPPIPDELARAKFTLGRDDNPTRFTQLQEQVKKWLPVWVDQFSVQQFGRITLTYRNLVSPELYPKMWNKNTLQIGEVLTYFHGRTPAIGALVPPYFTQVCMKLPDAPAYFRFFIENEGSTRILVNFEYADSRKVSRQSCEEVYEAVEEAHQLILSQFELYFTEEAKKHFV